MILEFSVARIICNSIAFGLAMALYAPLYALIAGRYIGKPFLTKKNKYFAWTASFILTTATLPLSMSCLIKSIWINAFIAFFITLIITLILQKISDDYIS